MAARMAARMGMGHEPGHRPPPSDDVSFFRRPPGEVRRAGSSKAARAKSTIGRNDRGPAAAERRARFKFRGADITHPQPRREPRPRHCQIQMIFPGHRMSSLNPRIAGGATSFSEAPVLPIGLRQANPTRAEFVAQDPSNGWASIRSGRATGLFRTSFSGGQRQRIVHRPRAGGSARSFLICDESVAAPRRVDPGAGPEPLPAASGASWASPICSSAMTLGVGEHISDRVRDPVSRPGGRGFAPTERRSMPIARHPYTQAACWPDGAACFSLRKAASSPRSRARSLADEPRRPAAISTPRCPFAGPRCSREIPAPAAATGARAAGLAISRTGGVA